MARLARRLLPFVVCLAAVTPMATADAIVTSRAMRASTIMEIFVERGGVRLEIEVGLRDVPAFLNLLPQEVHDRLDVPPAPETERLVRFFTDDLVIDADGAPLVGRRVSAELGTRVQRDEITGEPLAAADDDAEPVIRFVVEYPLASEPEALAFTIPEDGATVRAGLGFVLYHVGIAVNDFRYLPNGAIVDLDWEDPWHSRFRTRALRRAYDAPMNVFLYVEPYEVRVEVIVRPIDAQRWTDLGLAGRDAITPAMYGDVQGGVADLLADRLALTIDGEPVEPVLDRIHFLRRTLRTSTVIDPPEELDVFTAQLGAIFSVPRATLPQEAELTWALFTEKIPSVPAAATDEAGPMPGALTPEDPVLRWQNFLVNPTVPTMVEVEAPPRASARMLSRAGWSVALVVAALAIGSAVRFSRRRRVPWVTAGAGLLLVAVSFMAFQASRAAAVDGPRSAHIVGTLLQNVYRSFDYREEGAVYDALARSIDGDLLTQAYLQTKRSLELRNQGGARVKVNDVEIVACDPRPMDDGLGFVADCRWNVGGSVGHWGHLHQRQNQYTALVTVRAVDGAWRLTAMELTGEERL